MRKMTREGALKAISDSRRKGCRPRVHNRDLRGVDLAHANLRRATVECCDLRGADLSRAQLAGAQFRNCDLRDVTFGTANLAGAWIFAEDPSYPLIFSLDPGGSSSLARPAIPGRYPRPEQLLDSRGLRPRHSGLPVELWDELLPHGPEHRRLVEHLLGEEWPGTIREAIDTAGELAGRWAGVSG